MQGINLASRPFVNRRPVFRLAGLLWVLGAALLAVNVWQYSEHWRGSASYRDRLATAMAEIREEEAEKAEYDRALGAVDLSGQNGQTKYLNRLIAYRTFPWSALFDDLERVLPMDVRLINVRPNVRLVAEPPKKPRRRRRVPGRRQSQEESAEETSEEPAEEDELSKDEVGLRLTGVAKSEDVLYELVDLLFADPSFRRPILERDRRKSGETSLSFSLGVVYLTRRAVSEPPAEEEPPPAVTAEESGGEEGGVGDSGRDPAGPPAAGPEAARQASAGQDPNEPLAAVGEDTAESVRPDSAAAASDLRAESGAAPAAKAPRVEGEVIRRQPVAEEPYEARGSGRRGASGRQEPAAAEPPPARTPVTVPGVPIRRGRPAPSTTTPAAPDAGPGASSAPPPSGPPTAAPPASPEGTSSPVRPNASSTARLKASPALIEAVLQLAAIPPGGSGS